MDRCLLLVLVDTATKLARRVHLGHNQASARQDLYLVHADVPNKQSSGHVQPGPCQNKLVGLVLGVSPKKFVNVS